MRLRVGVDLVSVSDVRDSLRVHSDRYLARIYSPREVDDCRGGSPAVVPEHLAARFAAKEAAMKVLRSSAEGRDEAIPWNAIEVVRDDCGAPELELSGRAAEVARAAGLASVAVSLTHEREYAAAIVVAELDPGRLGKERTA